LGRSEQNFIPGKFSKSNLTLYCKVAVTSGADMSLLEQKKNSA